jgi:hypothetical protein
MSASNHTQNLGLPQYSQSDIPAWNDINVAFQYIDALAGAIAPVYDETETYAVGDYVLYNHVIYKCKTAIAVPESFDSTKWDNIIITTAMQDAEADLTNFVKYDSENGTGLTNAQFTKLAINQ